MEKLIKRAIDIFLSLLGIIILSPFLPALSILIKKDSPGPVLFKQERIGKDFKPFKIYKLRTMTTDTNTKELLITKAGDPRVTNIGSFLRKYKIDELPQLFNVLIGDMSLVGPRPEISKYVNIYRSDYERILTVRPGITDFAALEYKNEENLIKSFINPEKGYIKEVLPRKITLYKRYVEEQSVSVDFKILIRTFFSLLKTR